MRSRVLFIVVLALVASLLFSCKAFDRKYETVKPELRKLEIQKQDPALEKKINELIKKLDADDPHMRENAQDQLIEIGKPALGTLHKFLGGKPGGEPEWRARTAIHEIEWKDALSSLRKYCIENNLRPMKSREITPEYVNYNFHNYRFYFYSGEGFCRIYALKKNGAIQKFSQEDFRYKARLFENIVDEEKIKIYENGAATNFMKLFLMILKGQPFLCKEDRMGIEKVIIKRDGEYTYYIFTSERAFKEAKEIFEAFYIVVNRKCIVTSFGRDRFIKE